MKLELPHDEQVATPERRRIPLTLSLVASLALSCVGRDTSAAKPADSARPAQSASAAMHGTFVDGDERSDWTMTTSADGLVSIEDNARFGEDGHALRLFYFDGKGNLMRATEQRSQTVYAGNRSPSVLASEVIVDFSKSVPSGRKIVDGASSDVQSYEIENLRRRAAALREQAHR